VAIPQVTSILITALAASLFFDAAAASAGSSWRSSHRLPGACRNNTNQGALGHSYQSLQPTPGEIRGLGSRLEPQAPRPITREPCGRLNQSRLLWNALSRAPFSPPTGKLSEVNLMKPTFFVLPSMAAVLLAATAANAASPTFPGTSLGVRPWAHRSPTKRIPNAIGSPRSLQSIPNGGLGSGLG
jgi:hypothetical protein